MIAALMSLSKKNVWHWTSNPKTFCISMKTGVTKSRYRILEGLLGIKMCGPNVFQWVRAGTSAPEHFRLLNFKKDKKTDVYSLGVSFQKMFPVEKRPLFLQVLCEKMLEKDPPKAAHQ